MRDLAEKIESLIWRYRWYLASNRVHESLYRIFTKGPHHHGE